MHFFRDELRETLVRKVTLDRAEWRLGKFLSRRHPIDHAKILDHADGTMSEQIFRFVHRADDAAVGPSGGDHGQVGAIEITADRKIGGLDVEQKLL